MRIRDFRTVERNVREWWLLTPNICQVSCERVLDFYVIKEGKTMTTAWKLQRTYISVI